MSSMKERAPAGTPWVERYRPKSLQDISHQQEVVATLQNAVSTGRLPHLLFYGPPGSGKTSVALALCRQLWHPSDVKRRVLELNASDERGISVVRDKIKHFASLAVGKPVSTKNQLNFGKSNANTQNANAKEYPNPPFKIIILDEADTVTKDAQAALRRIIEAHSKITRFILICNYVTRIIEPLASRCAKFRFHALPPAAMKDRLLEIATAEDCRVQEDLVDAILHQAAGDMRRAVTTLQSVHALSDTDVHPDAVAEIAGVPPDAVVDTLWEAARTGVFDTMQTAVEGLTADGYAAQLLLTVLLDRLGPDAALTELDKAEVAIRLAQAEKKMLDGADEYLQLMTVCSHLCQCFAKAQSSQRRMDLQ